jgi:hypothetical protein
MKISIACLVYVIGQDEFSQIIIDQENGKMTSLLPPYIKIYIAIKQSN